MLLVEPRALDIKKAKASEPRECKRIERELRDWLIGARVGLVVEDVDGAVAHLKKVDVTGKDARPVSGKQANTVFNLKCVNTGSTGKRVEQLEGRADLSCATRSRSR